MIQPNIYSLLMMAGILLSVLMWRRNAPQRPGTALIFFFGLLGAFVGGKIVYVLAEGWLHWHEPDRWLHLATGKTIIGALLGGYIGVEIAKRAVNYGGVTGDWFATIVPISIIVGRVGCLLHGCCLGAPWDHQTWFTISDTTGSPRWPAVPLEITFNAIAAISFLLLRRKNILLGQHFHLYLIAYALFRFAHEYVRATPRVLGPLTGYQIAAGVVLLLGVIRFEQRRRGHLQPILVSAPISRAT